MRLDGRSVINEAEARALEAYLSRIEGFRGLRSLRKSADGQSNSTLLISADSGEYVLRRKPSGELLKSAHAIDREFRVLNALHGGAIPVPRPIHYCVDLGVIGSEFYLMEYVQGRHYSDPELHELEGRTRSSVYEAMNRVLVALTEVDLVAAGLDDFGPRAGYFER